MAKLEFNDERIESKEGETLVAAARRHGSYVWFLCDERGICQTCECRVISGDENLSEVSKLERAGLREKRRRKGYLLGCQAHLVGSGPVLVVNGACGSNSEGDRRGVRRAKVDGRYPAVRLSRLFAAEDRFSQFSAHRPVARFGGRLANIHPELLRQHRGIASTDRYRIYCQLYGVVRRFPSGCRRNALFGAISYVFLMGNLETVRIGPEAVAPGILAFHSMKLRNQ